MKRKKKTPVFYRYKVDTNPVLTYFNFVQPESFFTEQSIIRHYLVIFNIVICIWSKELFIFN